MHKDTHSIFHHEGQMSNCGQHSIKLPKALLKAVICQDYRSRVFVLTKNSFTGLVCQTWAWWRRFAWHHQLKCIDFLFIYQLRGYGDIAMSLAYVVVCPSVHPPVNISCPLKNLNTLWNTLMILHSYVELVMMMCCVQKGALALLRF